MGEASVNVATFAAASAAAAKHAPALGWLAAARERSLKRFTERGFPTTAEEDWRYTDLREAARRITDLLARPSPPATEETRRTLRERLIDGGVGPPIMLVDGTLAGDTAPGPTVVGLTVNALSAAPPAARDDLAARIAETGASDGALAALNAALLRQALVVDVAAGTELSTPIYIVCAAATDGAPQNRILVRLGRGSRASIVEHHLGIAAGVSNTVTELICDEDSALDYVKLQEESVAATHLASQRLRLAGGARARLLHLDVGARLSRNDLSVNLDGAGAEVSARGLFFADGERHLDNHTRIEHHAPRTVSRELYRGVVDERGRGVFNGKVIVHAGANGTDARLTSQNLLLSAAAEVDTKPELEIYADDVRCSHGATTGQLDPVAIFYLRSRGIEAAQARRMLIAAFVRELICQPPGAALAAHVARGLAGRLPELRTIAETP